MQEFDFQINYDNETYAVSRYTGDEKKVLVPGQFGGKPVTILLDKLFAGHSEIEEVVIPETVTDLGEFVFDGCENLRSLVLPAGFQYLWGYTFVRSGLEEIVLPDGVRSIPPYAFKDCKNLRRVVCGTGMKKIGAWAFGGCDSLEEVVCGENVEISPEAYSSNPAILRLS